MDVDELILGGSIYAYFEIKKVFVDAEVNITYSDIDSWSNNVTKIKVIMIKDLPFTLLSYFLTGSYRLHSGRTTNYSK